MLASEIYPVILSGGAGTRLWPISREQSPKQLQALINRDASLLQDTVLRFRDAERFCSPVIVCNDEHRFAIAEQMHSLGVMPDAIILEPAGRNTAPAIAAAAQHLADKPDAIMIVLPADHEIAELDAFQEAIDQAIGLARAGNMVTFGVKPTSPNTAYGYIQAGEALDVGGNRVIRFAEKPDEDVAAEYVAQGDYFWNSGMFVFSVATVLDELRKVTPQVLENCGEAVRQSVQDRDFLRLDKAAFERCENISFDYAVMENTDRAAVVPVDIGWNDVGSWRALRDIADKDADGNVLSGDVLTFGVSNSLIRADDRLVAAIGVEDLIVVQTADAVLVARSDADQDVKEIVGQLEAAGRREHRHHLRVDRPWGAYKLIDEELNFQVKKLIIKPGQAISLQKHEWRSEHWVVVSGIAKVTRGDEVVNLTVNQSTYIEIGMVHRLENPGDKDLILVEVQCGEYLGEDDIIRLEDKYRRND